MRCIVFEFSNAGSQSGLQQPKQRFRFRGVRRRPGTIAGRHRSAALCSEGISASSHAQPHPSVVVEGRPVPRAATPWFADAAPRVLVIRCWYGAQVRYSPGRLQDRSVAVNGTVPPGWLPDRRAGSHPPQGGGRWRAPKFRPRQRLLWRSSAPRPRPNCSAGDDRKRWDPFRQQHTARGRLFKTQTPVIGVACSRVALGDRITGRGAIT